MQFLDDLMARGEEVLNKQSGTIADYLAGRLDKLIDKTINPKKPAAVVATPMSQAPLMPSITLDPKILIAASAVGVIAFLVLGKKRRG